MNRFRIDFARLPFLLLALALLGSAPSLRAQSSASREFNGVALWQDGTAEPQRIARGYVDPVQRGVPLGASMRFPVVSVTKLLTSILVLQEVERGHLQLDGTVGAVWPQFPDAAVRALTLRQLLQHTSGLPNLDDAEPELDGMAGYYARRPVAPAALQAQVRQYAHGPLAFPPGTRFAYNNLDYLLLGAILERSTKTAYPTLVQTRLLTPLGMRDSALAGSRPLSYVPDAVFVDGVPRKAPTVYLQNFGPAGALISTVDDLSRLAAALLEDRLLTRATRAELFRGDIRLGYVALGVWSYPFSDDSLPQPVDVVERQGEAAGYRASLILLPQRNAWLVLLSNTDQLDFMTWNPASTTHRVLAGLLRGERLDALLPPLSD